MLIPQITFNEASVGASPILPNVRNRIGIIGQFSRGLANTFQYVDGFTQFSKLYGSDNTTGSLGYQAAWDQGARDFGIIRVLGRSRPAKGQIIFGGTANVDNNINLKISGIGLPQAGLSSFFRNTIAANGNYLGTESGRYVFVAVSALVNSNLVTGSEGPLFVGAATVGGSTTPYSASTYAVQFKYKFVPFTTERDPDKAIATLTPAVLAAIDTAPEVVPGEGTFVLDTSVGVLTGPVSQSIEQGFNILFGAEDEVLVFNKVNQVFTLLAEVWDFDIPVNVNDTAVELTNNFANVLSGADPLGTIDSQLDYIPGNTSVYTSTIDFYFDNDIIPGIEGNNYYYRFDLDTEDGTFNVDCYFDGYATPANNQTLLSTDPDAALLEVGDTITVPASSKFIIPAGAAVTTAVTGTGTSGDPYVIQIDQVITTTDTNDIAEADAETLIFDDISVVGGISIAPYQKFTSFEGGQEGPRRALVDLYSYTGTRLIEFQAISQGQWGNNLRLDIDPQPGGGFRCIVKDLQGATFNPPITDETYIINLADQGAVDEFGEIEAFKSSDLVRAFFVPKVISPSDFNVALLNEQPSRLAPAVSVDIITDVEDPAHINHFGPGRLGNVSFEGGYDGPILTEDDYVSAIEAFGGQNVHILCAPGIHTSSPRAQAQLVSVANNGTEVDGLKIAILNAQPGLKPEQAAAEAQAFNTSRAVMVAGWSTYGGQVSNAQFELSPDCLYAGHIASIGFQVSPAAKTSAGPVFNITDVDTRRYSSQQSLQLYTDGRLEVLRPDLNLGGFFFLNGRTTSASTAWDRIVIRRTYDVIRQDLYEALQPYQSEPHTKLLRRQVETSVNAYFQTLLRNAKIANALPAICNDSNNPNENYINGELNVSIGFLPLYAADYINVTITRNTDGGLEVGDDA